MIGSLYGIQPTARTRQYGAAPARIASYEQRGLMHGTALVVTALLRPACASPAPHQPSSDRAPTQSASARNGWSGLCLSAHTCRHTSRALQRPSSNTSWSLQRQPPGGSLTEARLCSAIPTRRHLLPPCEGHALHGILYGRAGYLCGAALRLGSFVLLGRALPLRHSPLLSDMHPAPSPVRERGGMG